MCSWNHEQIKIEFITSIDILYCQSSTGISFFNFHLTWLVFRRFFIKSDTTEVLE